MRLTIVLAALALVGCGGAAPDGVIRASVIGTSPGRSADPDREPLSLPEARLLGATAQGLVALDGQGQVEPALAESWITTEDGMSTIFRLRRARWPDGSEVTGAEVAASLDRALAGNSRNRLRPLLSAVDSVVGMTGRVVEIRLKTPRPNLLQLLAQPELGIRRADVGAGPWRIVRQQGAALRLVLDSDPDDGTADDAAPVLVLRTERAARAVARFMAGDADWVDGGTLADLPIARAATLRPGRLRFDPVQGLFGLAIVGRSRFLANPDTRAALAMAIDRDALAEAIGVSDYITLDGVLPTALDSGSDAARPEWSGTAIAIRRADAAQRIGAARPVLRIALPSGPGMRLLFAAIAADWGRIGVEAVAVPLDDASADLRLIDAVAPNTSANWYLTSLSCAAGLVCDGAGDTALLASRAATTLADRAARIADADAVLARRGSFIALGLPLRWALVDPSLTSWKENAFAAHPFAELRPGR